MFIFRSVIYLFIVAAVAHLISLEGYQKLSDAQYNEHSLTEYMQDIFAFFSVILFLCAARLDRDLRAASLLLAALLAMMFVRESDSLLDQYVFDGAWQLIVSTILVSVLVLSFNKYASIYKSLKSYSLQPSFGVLLAGMLTILSFSRLLGRGDFWQAVMGDSYLRLVKNIVEEGVETLGYTLILISATELVIVCLKRNRLPARFKAATCKIL